MNDSKIFPDITGYYLVDAINILSEHNIEVSNIKITAPPKHIGQTYSDKFRVLRMFVINKNKVDLLICDPMINC